MKRFQAILTFDTELSETEISEHIISTLDKIQYLTGKVLNNPVVSEIKQILDETQLRMTRAVEETLEHPEFQKIIHENDIKRFDKYEDAIEFCFNNNKTFKGHLITNKTWVVMKVEEKYEVIRYFMSDNKPVYATISDTGYLFQCDDAPDISKFVVFLLLKKIVFEHLDLKENTKFDMNSNLIHLGADELDLIELVMMFEAIFEVDIDDIPLYVNSSEEALVANADVENWVNIIAKLYYKIKKIEDLTE